MKTIWKRSIPYPGNYTVELPKPAIIVKFGLDPAGELCVWAEVEPEERLFRRDFCIIGTGHGVPEGKEYFDSVTKGDYVWHLYL